MSIIQDSKSLSEWIACCIRKHVKGDGSMTRDQCIAAAHQKFGVSKDFIESILREDAIPECVFARMECLEKKYPSVFTIKERLDLSYEYCSSYTKANDFGNGQFFVYVEDLLGSEKLKKLIEYRALKSVWEFVRTIGAPILYDKENDIEYEGKLVLKKHKPEDFLVEDVKPYYDSKIGSGETPAERAKKKAQKAYEAYKKNLNTPTEAPGTQVRNLPETPVSSSNVMTEAVVNNKLYLRFHSSPLFSYKYIFGSNEEALQAADELTKNSPGRYVWKSLRGKELGPVFGKPQKLTSGGTSASLVPYDKSRYSRIKQYMGRMPEIEAKYGSLEEIAESLRQTKMGIKEERAPEEETEKGELEAGGTSGAPFRPKELEKYQEGIYKEKKKRKKYKEEAKSMIEKLRKKHMDLLTEDVIAEILDEYGAKEKYLMVKGIAPATEPNYVFIKIIDANGNEETIEVDAKKIVELAKKIKAREKKKGRGWYGEPERHSKARKEGKADLLIEDSIDELFEWVRKHTDAKDEEEVKEIAFMISKARQKKGKKIGTKKDWKETMNEIGEELDKRRKARQRLREQRKGEQNLIQRSLYSSLDYNEVEYVSYLEEELAKHDFYLEEHLDEFYDFIEGYDKDFDPNQKGHWITSRGKHIFIPEGHSLSFGKNGEYSTSKSKKEEILSKVQKIKKEKRIRKLMEEGNTREIAERKAEDEEIEQEQKRKKEERKKKEPSKKEPTISKGIQTKISRKQEAINKRLDKLRSVSKGKSSGQIIGELITLTLRMLQQASKKGGSPVVPFAQYISKIRKDDRIEKEQKIKLISEIDKLKKEISSLKQDFIILNETIELEEELEQYDFHLEDNLEDFYEFVGDFDISKSGRWITKNGKRIYLQDVEYYTEEELNPYNISDLINPLLKIDKRINLKKKSYKIDIINRTLNAFPRNLQKMVNEVRVYNKITQDPSMRADKGRIPESYKKVGWNKSYDKIEGVYLIEENNVILTPDAYEHTTRHEVGHAVWYNLTKRDQNKFIEIHNAQKPLMRQVANKLMRESKKYDKDSLDSLFRKGEAEGIRYEANDIEEFFAESLARYYEAKAPLFSWQKKSNQKQPSSEVATFFRTRMKKYENEENPIEIIANQI